LIISEARDFLKRSIPFMRLAHPSQGVHRECLKPCGRRSKKHNPLKELPYLTLIAI
jgi:hypothetical protein